MFHTFVSIWITNADTLRADLHTFLRTNICRSKKMFVTKVLEKSDTHYYAPLPFAVVDIHIK